MTQAISTSDFMGLARRAFNRVLGSRRAPANIEIGRWNAVAFRRDFAADIDEYRARRGKEEGEAAFFRDNKPTKELVRYQNLLMFNGTCLLFQAAINAGSATANQGFAAGVSLLTNSNSYLYVSDGAPTGITGTLSATNNTAAFTTSSGSSGLSIGALLTITGDSSSQVYTVATGSGTSWTMSPVYGGATQSGLAAGFFAAPSHSNTTFPGSTNLANQVADSTFPSNPFASIFQSITGATNASPIVLSVSAQSDISANDIASVVETIGNTAANGIWLINPAGSTALTLVGSSGNGSWTSGGLVTKRNVLTMQSTFGATAAVFQWNAWGFTNGNGSNKILLNWKGVGMGTKANGTSSALKIGLSIV
jgi:hypothetical protein